MLSRASTAAVLILATVVPTQTARFRTTTLFALANLATQATRYTAARRVSFP